MANVIRIWSFGDVDRSGKVRWTAEELGYEIEERRLKLGEHAAEPYVGLNPYQQIPAAEFDGETFIESTAICILLAERHPEQALIPEERALRDRFWQSLNVSASTLEIPVVSYYLSHVGFIDEAWAKLWREPLARRLGVFAGDVPAEDFICGAFSVADICAAYVLRIGVQAGLLAYDGRLGRYLDRLRSRPAAQASRVFDSLD